MTAALQPLPTPVIVAQPKRWRRPAAWAGALALVGMAAAVARPFDLSWSSLGAILCLMTVPLLLVMWLADPLADTNGKAAKS